MSPWSAILWKSNWLRSMKKNVHIWTTKNDTQFQSLVLWLVTAILPGTIIPSPAARIVWKGWLAFVFRASSRKGRKWSRLNFFRHPVRSVYCLQSIKKVATAETFFGALSWLSFVNITSERLFWRAIGLCLATLKIPGVWLAREVSSGSLKIGLGIHNHWGKLSKNQF